MIYISVLVNVYRNEQSELIVIGCLNVVESNERLQSHLKERMHSLEEKNHLSNEIERMKKKIEEGEQNKARLQSQLEAQNLEIYNLKLFGQQQQQQNTNYNSVEYRYVILMCQSKLMVFLFFSYTFIQILPAHRLRSKYISGGNFEGITKISVRGRKRSKANASAGNSF